MILLGFFKNLENLVNSCFKRDRDRVPGKFSTGSETSSNTPDGLSVYLCLSAMTLLFLV